MKRTLIIAVTGLALILTLGSPAMAQSSMTNYSVGGGYWTMPGVDTQNGTIDDAGFFASISMLGSNYYMEFDYSLADTDFYALAADYVYPINQSAGMFGGSTFLGAGYTYFSSDTLDNESGFNLIAGVTMSDGLIGTVRYDYLGSDQELMTFGLTYKF